MPIYEYECGACGHQLEAFQSISEPALTQCPKCNRPALGKLISSTSFQLKGTGWYATDFRDKGKPPAPAAEKSTNDTKATTGTATGSATGSDSKSND